MKKWIIGSFVGAILIFGWQYLSWEGLQLHKGAFQYTSAQDSILNVLSSTLQKDGSYFIPNVPPGTSNKEKMEKMKNNEGKPWAWVTYHPKMENNMVMTMIRSFLVNFVIVLLLVVVLTKGGLPGSIGIFTGSLAVGVLTFLWGPYTGHVWFQTPWENMRGDMIDAVVAWGLCGAWLGWWLRR